MERGNREYKLEGKVEIGKTESILQNKLKEKRIKAFISHMETSVRINKSTKGKRDKWIKDNT